jgi:putative transposase
METLDQAVARLAPAVGTVRACRAVGQPRSSWYRRHRQSPPPPLRPRRPAVAPQPRALSPVERQAVLDVLHDERFCDQAPASVWATLLDEGSYLCSPRRFTGCCASRERPAIGAATPPTPPG